MITQLQEQVNTWRNKYEALAKLYSQLRTEHLDMLSKFKQFQLKANSAQEAIDKMERMEKNLNAKNLELADMIRERDRARFELDRQKSSHKDELDRLRREINFANERAEDATRSKSSEVSHVLSKYNRQVQELEDSLRVCFFFLIRPIPCYGFLWRLFFRRRNKFKSTICSTSWVIHRRIWSACVRRRNKRLLFFKREWIAPSNSSPMLSR